MVFNPFRLTLTGYIYGYGYYVNFFKHEEGDEYLTILLLVFITITVLYIYILGYCVVLNIEANGNCEAQGRKKHHFFSN